MNFAELMHEIATDEIFKSILKSIHSFSTIGICDIDVSLYELDEYELEKIGGNWKSTAEKFRNLGFNVGIIEDKMIIKW